MAGATVDVRREWSLFTLAGAVARPFLRAIYEEFNDLVDDVDRMTIGVSVEDLGAGVDIAARAFWRAPAAGNVKRVDVTYRAASAGVGASPNDAVITLRNITQAVDIATVTLTANVSANGTSNLTVTAANKDYAAGDIFGVVVTQNGTADLPALDFTIVLEAMASKLNTVESGD